MKLAAFFKLLSTNNHYKIKSCTPLI